MNPPLLHTSRIAIGFSLLVLLSAASAPASSEFPELTGRVVDRADLLPVDIEQQLSRQLEQHEQETGNQVVVVTLPSLEGRDIEDYGYRLGRHWGIGQAGHDNGVLLIVAAGERKLRIEVGYGLEGTLTDALSHNIIQQVILPQFRKDHYSEGIQLGTGAILGALQGTYKPVPPRQPGLSGIYLGWIIILLSIGEFVAGWFSSRLVSAGVMGGITLLFGWLVLGSLAVGLAIAFFVAVFHFFIDGGGGPAGRHGSGYYGGGGFSGGGSFGGGGFSGGGGSFGGGGASGRW